MRCHYNSFWSSSLFIDVLGERRAAKTLHLGLGSGATNKRFPSHPTTDRLASFRRPEQDSFAWCISRGKDDRSSTMLVLDACRTSRYVPNAFNRVLLRRIGLCDNWQTFIVEVDKALAIGNCRISHHSITGLANVRQKISAAKGVVCRCSSRLPRSVWHPLSWYRCW